MDRHHHSKLACTHLPRIITAKFGDYYDLQEMRGKESQPVSQSQLHTLWEKRLRLYRLRKPAGGTLAFYVAVGKSPSMLG